METFTSSDTFSAADSQAILKLVKSYSPNLPRLLDNLVAKKKSIVMLVPGINIAEHVRRASDELHRRNNEFNDA
ncbi:hypothetical protein E4T56_gene4137 [Termitomyces sp. T112]|nr:hypothetical protein E4T56_gene4137 [Termitomyces sp. T112]